MTFFVYKKSVFLIVFDESFLVLFLSFGGGSCTRFLTKKGVWRADYIIIS